MMVTLQQLNQLEEKLSGLLKYLETTNMSLLDKYTNKNSMAFVCLT